MALFEEGQDKKIGACTDPTSFWGTRRKPGFVAFWRALCDGHVRLSAVRVKRTQQECQLLTLPEGVFILGDSDLGSSMMVRSCYHDLYNIVSGTTSTDHRWVIIGSPGIGKTLFIAYVLWQLAQQQTTVVYEPHDTNVKSYPQYLMLPNGTIKEMSRSDYSLADVLRDPDTWLIADAHCPSRVKARTLLITYPDYPIYRKFEDLPCTEKLFMPVWTWDEIEACRSTIFATRVTVKRAAELFKMCGGIPRHVLQNAHIDIEEEIRRAIVKFKLEDYWVYVYGMTSDDDLLHLGMHTCLIGDSTTYTDCCSMFASQWITDRVVKNHLEWERRGFVRFLRNSASDKYIVVLRNQLFESYAHYLLHSGGNFTWRRVLAVVDSTQPEAPVALTKSILHSFSNLTQVDLTQPDVYYRPMSKHLAVVDALASGGLLFQMTVSRCHNIKMDNLLKALERVPAEVTHPKLVFVVPADVFPTFTAQNYVTATGSVWQGALPSRVQAIEQWVLQIPL